MAMARCITEMGMGVDVHGLDYTSAAKLAVFDGFHHSSLGFQRLLGKSADDIRVDITIGVPAPEEVDGDAVAATLPHGTNRPFRWQSPALGSRNRRRHLESDASTPVDRRKLAPVRLLPVLRKV